MTGPEMVRANLPIAASLFSRGSCFRQHPPHLSNSYQSRSTVLKAGSFGPPFFLFRLLARAQAIADDGLREIEGSFS